MKLNSHYKFESTFSLNEIITSEKIHAIISDAARQIAELQSKRRVEILEINYYGLCTFGVEGCNKSEYPIYWIVQFNMDKVCEYLSQYDPIRSKDYYLELFDEFKWSLSENYLNQVDFETLEYL